MYTISYYSTFEEFQAMGYTKDQYEGFKQYIFDRLSEEYPNHCIEMIESDNLETIITDDYVNEYGIWNFANCMFDRWCSLQ